MGARAGVLGGTFDPPHIGHLLLAEQAADALGLARVWFVPAADPPHKGAEVTAVAHRVAMVEAAIAGNPRFAMSRVDLDRPGPHYTVDTLALLRKEWPDTELYFLMGGDSLRDFSKWRDPAGIMRTARLGVIRRPGANLDLTQIEAAVPGLTERITFVDTPEIGLSATLIRERRRAGLSIRYQVPVEVEQYMSQHALYMD